MFLIAKLSRCQAEKEKIGGQLVAEERQRRENPITSLTLHVLSMLAWRALFGSSSDQALILLT